MHIFSRKAWISLALALAVAAQAMSQAKVVWSWSDVGASWPRDAGASWPRDAEGRGTDRPAAVWLDAGAARQGLTGDELMDVVWKSEKLASMPGADFDTWKLSFVGNSGRVALVREWELRSGGAREVATYRVIRGGSLAGEGPAGEASPGEGLAIISRREGAAPESRAFATLVKRGEAWEATTAVQRCVYRPLPGGGIGVARELYGAPRNEEYLPGGRSVSGAEGGPARRGHFEADDAPLSYVERLPDDPEGILDLMYWYDRVEADAVSVSVGDVEPRGEGRIVGLSTLMSGPAGLENLVIADLVLGPDRRLTPVLAWAWLGEVPVRTP